MEMKDDKNKKPQQAKPAKADKPKQPQQEWEPHWSVQLLRSVWTVAFTVLKIAFGAAATVAIICILCMLVFAGVLGDYLQQDVIPLAEAMDIEDFGLELKSTMYYTDASGNIKELQVLHSEINREWASLDEIPEDLINATIAIEDKRFYEHQGVDWVTTIKACAGMFLGGGDAGGSTITQQLVKNLTQENSFTVQRKVLEWFRAASVEKRYDKDAILELYLNRIYLGQGCYGVRSAAEVYFGKELELLTTAECASLISITNNPSLFDPYAKEFNYQHGNQEPQVLSGAERNRLRQVDTLWEMRNQGLITEEEYQIALNQEMVFKNGVDPMDRLSSCVNVDCGYRNIVSTFKQDGEKFYCPMCGTLTEIDLSASQSVYSWFVDTVYEDVAQMLAERDGVEWNNLTKKTYKKYISQAGLNIYTTLDMDVQNQVDKIYTDLSQIPTARSAQQLQSAIVVVDNKTGFIIAMAGGVGEKVVHDAWNRATDSALQTGSSIKPLTVYAPAFELGVITPATVIKDLPLYTKPTAFPLNDNRKYSNSRTIFSAVVNSVNAVAANVVKEITPEYSFNFGKTKFGLSGLVEEYPGWNGTVLSDIDYAPLALGAQTKGISVRDMASAFATFANDGVYREGLTFTKVYDSEGNLILDNTQDTRSILSKKTVDYMNYCLLNAVTSGTGAAAYIDGHNVAGKTGTTGDNKDRWFCGYSKYYTAAVWCGYDIPEVIYLTGSSKSNPACRLFKKVMAPLHSGLPSKKLYDSSAMTTVSVCLDSGMKATDACRADVRLSMSGLSSGFQNRVQDARVYREDKPKKECDKHVLVDYCVDGVANEYCRKFAEAGVITLSERALVKMTQAEIDELLDAKKYKLLTEYLMDEYVYLVKKNGSDDTWKGFDNDINKNVDAPYKVCTVHTAQSWQEYLDAQTPPESTEPAQTGN
jgi:penicillin-binding protein 1A